MSRYLLSHEVAEVLRVSPDDVRQLVAEGRLRARRVRPRGQLLFEEADVEAALRDARAPQPACAGAG